jgi:hypothetical protein
MMLNRFPITSESLVVEVASNDGYLLQYFKEQHVKVLGIEPATNVAKEAEKKGISTINEFFGTKMAQKLVKEEIKADVLLGNNVIAHVPDINDFVAGMKILLKGHGVITMEFPHLLRLMEQRQFDTIYHEHFSYLSFGTIRNIFATHGLRLFDVDELPTHGGSLRIYACHDTFSGHDTTKKVEQLLQKETVAGLKDINVYRSFTKKVQAVKLELLEALIALKKQGHSIVAYGAPAKGNTILNYCGIRTDLIEYTVDRSPHKQGKFLPGTHIPIFAPDKIKETRPDYVVILPWNLKQEIIEQMKYIRSWGGRFIVAIPKLEVL